MSPSQGSPVRGPSRSLEDDGSLLCSYHGWRFEGTQGKLVDAPQLEPDSAQLMAVQKNPKSRCNSFPLQVIDGVLWVCPEAGDDARLESALTPAQSYKGLEEKQTNSDRIWYGPWNYRQLPYGADFFIENVVDPAHVGISHHNVVGNRYSDQRMSLDHITKLRKNGCSFHTTNPNNTQNSTTTFAAPSLVAIEASFGDKGAFQLLELYVSPSLPGFSNHVGRMVIVKDESGTMPRLFKQFTAPIPKWLNHVLAAAFLNQDAVFLHQQERLMAKKGEYTTLHNTPQSAAARDDYSQVVLPVDADKGVLFYRQWMAKLAGGRIPYKNNPSMPLVDPTVCFDQYHPQPHGQISNLSNRAGAIEKGPLCFLFCGHVSRRLASFTATPPLEFGLGFGDGRFGSGPEQVDWYVLQV